jgi:hypothetical protein
MKKLLLPLVASAALAAPTSALAWGSHHHHHAGIRFAFFAKSGDNDGDHSDALFAKLSGTGSSFGANSATATGSIVAGNDHPNGHFSVSLTTDWSTATTKTWTDNDGDSDDGTVTVSCAPATGSVTLTNGSTSTASLTGKECSWTRNGTTKYGFFGRSSDGKTRAFLKEDGSTVKGAVITGDGFAFGWHH